MYAAAQIVRSCGLVVVESELAYGSQMSATLDGSMELGPIPKPPLINLGYGAPDCTRATTLIPKTPASAATSLMRRAKGISVTIYSQHANRGKVQILATYRGPGGVVSSTVTSLGSSDEAAPLVDALNRVSALATLPMSVFDMRGHRVRSYPSRHIDALTDVQVRDDLLTGTHGLWYEYVCFELHCAFGDLEEALAPAPDPVRIAVRAEVAKEAQLLRVAAADADGTEAAPTEDIERLWEHGKPFVLYDGGMDALSTEVRENLNDFEGDATDEERATAVADLRVLATASSLCTGVDHLHLEASYLDLVYDPFGQDKLFLTIGAPQPGEDGPRAWSIDIQQWVPDDLDDDEDEFGSATGQSVLRCELPARPSAESLADVVCRLDREPQLFARIVKAAQVGSPLESTQFVVTAIGED
jgi:hypothetical protein